MATPSTIPFPVLYTQFDSLAQQIQQAYNQDKVVMAYDLLLQVEYAIKYYETYQGPGMDPAAMRALQQKYAASLAPISPKIKKAREEIEAMLNEFNSYNGWTKTYDSNGIQTFYRHEGNTPIHSLRMEGLINAPIFDVLAVLNEADLYSTWVPMMKESVILQNTSRYGKVCYMRIELPWPMWARDLLLVAYGVDMLDRDSILVICRSPLPSEPFPNPPVPNKHVRMEINFGGMLIQPVSATQTRIRWIVNCDAKLTHIPSWFLNTATHQTSYMILDTLRQKCQNVRGSEYEQRINQNQAVYGPARDLLNQYFAKKQNITQPQPLQGQPQQPSLVAQKMPAQYYGSPAFVQRH